MVETNYSRCNYGVTNEREQIHWRHVGGFKPINGARPQPDAQEKAHIALGVPRSKFPLHVGDQKVKLTLLDSFQDS